MNRDNQPIKSKGYYDLNFIDWNNELESIISSGFDYDNYDLNGPSPIPGMSVEMFLQLYENNDSYDEELNESGLSKEEIINLIKTMKIMKTSKTCSICVLDFVKGELIKKLPCNHIFHEKCIIPWLKQKTQCPNCKLDLKEYFKNKLDL